MVAHVWHQSVKFLRDIVILSSFAAIDQHFKAAGVSVPHRIVCVLEHV